MATIKYQITFFSEWHTGSGLSSGSDLDALVIKDKKGLPYIPGKTIKGLLKDAANQIRGLQGKADEPNELNTQFFGYAEEGKPETESIHTRGMAHFSNAILPIELVENIPNDQVGFLYRSLASTAIEECGLAKSNSLRRMETTIPCRLVGEIHNVDDIYKNDLIKAFKWIKRLGQNRNRGLGRCNFEILGEEVSA